MLATGVVMYLFKQRTNGRRRIEARAKNVRKKTTEGVGCEGRRLGETGNARFLDANALHIARMVEL